MNVVTYNTSLKDAEKLLKEFGVFKKSGDSTRPFSAELKKISKSANIIELHNFITSNSEFSFLLNDDSVFQFSKEGDELRYSFIQTPYKYLTIEQYVETMYSREFLEELMDEYTSVENFYPVIQEDYEQFLETQGLTANFNYVRYDFSDIGYHPMLHSKSHLHIGTNSNLRIPLSKYFTPLKFVKFCLKNTYYREWKDFFLKKTDQNKFLKDIKNMCAELDSKDWHNSEENEFFMS